MSQAISETFVEIRAELDGLRADLAKGNKMLGNMGKGVKFAGLTSAFTGITAAIGVIKIAAAGIAAPFKLAFKAIRTAAKIAMSVVRTVFSSVIGVAKMVGRAIREAFDFGKQYIKGAISVAKDFSEQMSAVGALTSSVGTKDFTVLREKALSLGRATEFSATQAAMGMANFARTGQDVNEILDSIGPTLDFATANFLDLNEASDIAARVMGGMGLSANEVTRAMDAMTVGANKSNQNVVDLGEAMKNVGASAKAADMSLEQTVATMMAFADAGRRGGEAGTALKQILLKMPSKQATKLFKGLGISAEDAGTGGFRPLADIIDDLNKSMEGMDEFKKLEKIIGAFGTRAGPGLVSLLTTGGDAIRGYTKLIEDNAGMAARNAEVQRGSLANSFKIVSSAADDLRIRLVDVLDPLIRGANENAIKALNFLSSFVQNKGPEIRDFLVGAFVEAKDGIVDALTVAVGFVALQKDKIVEIWSGLTTNLDGIGASMGASVSSFFGQDLVDANTGPVEKIVLALEVAFIKIKSGFERVVVGIKSALRTLLFKFENTYEQILFTMNPMGKQQLSRSQRRAAVQPGKEAARTGSAMDRIDADEAAALAAAAARAIASGGASGRDLTDSSRERGKQVLGGIANTISGLALDKSSPIARVFNNIKSAFSESELAKSVGKGMTSWSDAYSAAIDSHVKSLANDDDADGGAPGPQAAASAMSGTVDTVFGAFKVSGDKQVGLLTKIAKSSQGLLNATKSGTGLGGAFTN